MPCEDCIHGCEPDCGHSPTYSTVSTEFCGIEHDVFCDGFEYGDPSEQCGDIGRQIGCIICKRVRMSHLNENPFGE